jgi:hypothetical protein
MLERIARRIGAPACALLCAVFAVGAPDAASAAALRQGGATVEESLAGVRYRAFRNTRRSEIQLGVPELAPADRRSARDVTWVAGANDVAFTFDPALDRLTTTVSNSAGEFSLEFPGLATAIAALSSGRFGTDDLNVVRIRILDRDVDSRVVLRAVELDGEALGDVAADGDGDAVWTIHGHDFAAGFTLRGTIELEGRFSARADRSRIDIEVGVSGDPFCLSNDAVADVRAVLDGESPFRLYSVVGTPYDPRLTRVGWSFLADDTLYLDGNRERSYDLCSTDAGVMMAIPFRNFGGSRTAHFALELVEGGFEMHGMQRGFGEDGVPFYLEAGLEFGFRSR